MSGKYALIIGNTEYTDSRLPQLNAPSKDAEDFARILNDHDIGAFDSVNVLLNQPSSSVLEAIDEFFDEKKPDDMLVLYFSGHGIKDELGSLYLAFKNTIRSRLRATAIKSDYIREAMDQSRSKRQVLILDCCNSGAFPSGTKAEIGGAMGMAKAFQGYGRFVLTASDATQLAWEGDQFIGEIKNSLFTHFLVKGLEGEADSDGDGRITVDELYDYAYDQISRVTPKQTPTKSSSKVEGEIVLRQNMRIEDIKSVPLPAELMDEIEDLRPYVREVAVQKLQKILKGKNIGLARSAREALEKIAADENTTRRVEQIATQILESIKQAEQLAMQRAEVERIVVQKAEEERIAQEKAEAERKAKKEAEQLAEQKAEEERIAKAKLEVEQLAKEKRLAKEKQRAEEVEVERKAKEAAEQLAKQKLEEERAAKARLEAERLAEEKRRAEEEAKAEQKAREDAEQLTKQKAEEERIAKAEANRKAKEEEARQKEWFEKTWQEAEQKLNKEAQKLASAQVSGHEGTKQPIDDAEGKATITDTKKKSIKEREREEYVYVIVYQGTPLYHSFLASTWTTWLEEGSKLSITEPVEDALKRIGKYGHYIKVADSQGNQGYVLATAVSSDSVIFQKVAADRKNEVKIEEEDKLNTDIANNNSLPFILSWKGRILFGAILGIIIGVAVGAGFEPALLLFLVICGLAGLITYPHKSSIILLPLGFLATGIFYSSTAFDFIVIGALLGLPTGALISRILYWLKAIK